MTRLGGAGRIVTAVLLLLIAVTPISGATAAAPITVAQAVSGQGSGPATVEGYVVGQPTATTTVVTSGFPSDFALALADAPGVTDPAAMVYVQIPSAFRAAWGLASNPGLLGDKISVTGTLGAYFSHAGVTSPTAFAVAGTGGSGGSTGGETGGGTGGGTAPADYYTGVTGLTGAALRDRLHTIISVQTKLTYDQVWNALKVTDQDPANANNVLLIYSGISRPKTSNGGGSGQWNREHVWPQSHGDFGTATGPGTDLHHLRPEDVTVNSTRGNKDFDLGGSAVANCSGCRTDADSFEPPAAVKGDVARMVLYMAIRYEGTDGWPDLEANDTVNGQVPRLGRLSLLLAWNEADPPSAAERRRNDIIDAQFQGNRNPFIDHPEWARAIWG